ncbi:MAG TPA: MFS transporter [Fimbriimonadales bacterium]|nr:MFS transporter [Fimbriimonadales bacterium]
MPLQALRHRDFRLWWIGAFLSFVGTWVQNTGQQWLVYELTGSETALGLLTFLQSAPMFLLGPLGGWLADHCNKRIVLITASSIFALSAFMLAIAVWTNQISFFLIAIFALVNGCTAVIEIPTRLSTIAQIVPQEELANALPLNSATFNTARVVGPVIGGILLNAFGASVCYFVNGISYAAIILALLAIQADLRAPQHESAPLFETLFDGIRHVFREKAFLMLVSMMSTTSFFGMYYLSQISSLAKARLHLAEGGYSLLFTSSGIGALVGLTLLATTSHKPYKGLVVSIAMLGFGCSMIGLSLVTLPVAAMLCLGFMGMFGIMQMVGTNTLLQYYSPPELRGRVVAVHAWSLSGLSPFGAILFGWIGERSGLGTAFSISGFVIASIAFLVLLFGGAIRSLR